MADKSYGSGYFGEWIKDEFDLPAYRYTCDQITDPKAKTPVNEAFRGKTDHSFMVGNDRIVGVASNYGYIQIRQDEGGPKFLNDYDPKKDQFAGGFGYLTDGKTLISTYYNHQCETFERIYGMGYFRKIVKKEGLEVNQLIFAPFGDDPLVISRVTIKNSRIDDVNLRWIEYWGSKLYQFSYTDFMNALPTKDMSRMVVTRREFSSKFLNSFEVIGNKRGLINKKFLENQQETSRIKKPSYEDRYPAKIFLVSLDSPFNSYSTNSTHFFGKGGTNNPDLLMDDSSTLGPESAMILERIVSLGPNESTTLYFMYGYLPEGFVLAKLISQYSYDLEQLFPNSQKKWKSNSPQFVVNGEDWVNREVMWHYAYLRGGMTYDDYFQEHILSQGQGYQYIIGIQAAARDPLQHALPFCLLEPTIVKNVIRYTLKTIDKSGEIPWGMCGNGKKQPSPFRPSDLQLWLLWLVSEYVLITRDSSFLDEEIPTYPIYGSRAGKDTVLNLINQCVKYFIEVIGKGSHGLSKLSNGDWNDGVVIAYAPSEKHEEIKKVAETVLNSAMCTYVLEQYAIMLRFIGKEDKSNKYLDYVNDVRNSITVQWTGKWFKRAWLCDDIGWVGENEMWLEPQPWAILGGAASSTQKEILINSIDSLIRKPTVLGAMLLSKPLEALKSPPGTGINCGQWISINGTLIMALAREVPSMAWDEWIKNSRAWHAEHYPDIWYATWSGTDYFNTALSKYPGQTGFDEIFLYENSEDTSHEVSLDRLNFGFNWTDFPVFNLHVHAWPLFTLGYLIGLKFTREGLIIEPKLPKYDYQFKSRIFGFKKQSWGYSGWYAPMEEGNWKVILKFSMNEIIKFRSLSVNGKEIKIVRKENSIRFQGKNTINSPLSWEIKY